MPPSKNDMPDERFHLLISYFVCLCKPCSDWGAIHAVDMDKLVKKADQAMYKAKEKRNGNASDKDTQQ
jgi:GGDEF domain-containing protein